MPCLERVVIGCVLRVGGIGDGFGVECDGAGTDGTETDGAETDGAGDGLEDVGKVE